MEVKSLVHDILNSLTVIDGNLSLALKESDSEKMKIRIQKAILANGKAVEICQTQLEDKKKVLVDVRDFYSLSLKVFQNLYTKIDIKFEGHFAGGQRVDKTFFFRANENIIKNSIEAGATKLVIICTEEKISFIDNGLGMSVDSVRAISENGTSKKTGHGIGLGSIASFCSDHGFRLKFGNNHEKDIFKTGFHIHILFNS